MSYIDQYDLASDLAFRKQVSVAMANAAINVAGEAKGAFSDVKYSKRQTLARAVLTTPSGYLEQFALAIAQDASIGAGSAVNISSSTNAYPIVVTTAAAHGLSTGNAVRITDHLVNTAANGTWTVTNLTSTTFSIPVAGVGVGSATGRIVKLPTDAAVQNMCNAIWDDMSGVTVLD